MEEKMTIRFPVRSPSVERLRKELKIDLGHAQLIKQQCVLGHPHAALKLANEAMGGFGIENLYPDAGYIYYINMGDTYSLTLLYNDNSNTMWIGTWGDWYEKSTVYRRHLKEEKRYLKEGRKK
jgi:hypothetical protein